MKRFFIILLFLIFSILPLKILATDMFDVVINEIAWMGTINSANDEWIELYNNSNQDINLEGWGLYEQGGETLIEPLNGIIKANSYYLLERTDDETVPDIPASQEPTSWSGHGLKNSGEHLQLLDNKSNLIDEVKCSDGWFAGDNKSKQTMERRNSLVSGNNSSNWQTSQNPEGTPKAENSEQRTMNNEQKKVESPNIEEKSEIINYPKGIVFNEILPSPEGPDAENEWIVPTNEHFLCS